MGAFRNLRDLCRGLFGGRGFNSSDIVDISAGDAAGGLPRAAVKGVRVAFTLTYGAVRRLGRGGAHLALERLILSACDDEGA